MFLYCSIPITAGAATRDEKMAVQGERIAGGFILITEIDGARYAVRQQAITVFHDADEYRNAIVQLHGGPVVRDFARWMKFWLGSYDTARVWRRCAEHSGGAVYRVLG